MANKIQGNYDELSQAAQEFGRQAEASQNLTQQVQRGVDGLASGGWVGAGAEAFVREMQELVFPGMSRLFDALNEANQVTQRIIQLFRDAEAEAARFFQPYAFNGDGGGFMDRVADLADDAVQRAKIAGMGVISNVVGALSTLFPGLEATHTAIQEQIMDMRTNLAYDMIADIPGLDPTAWAKLDINQRVEVLNQVHGAYASAFGMPPGNISVADSATLGANVLGDSDGNNIRLLDTRVAGGDVRAIVNTIVHETRHNVQSHAIGAPPSYSYIPENTITTWETNWANYIQAGDPDPFGGTYTWEQYRHQPIEEDAWNAGDSAAGELYTDR